MIADRSFEEIREGDSASFERAFAEEDIRAFAELSGDHNPLHTDPAYAATTRFGKPIAHGMLVASLFSTLLGMHLPGKRCLYLSQSLTFRKPAYAGETLTVEGVVKRKSEATRTLEIELRAAKAGEEVAGGTALVQVL